MRQRILRAIAEFTRDQERPPTVRDLCHVLGVESTGHISYHLKQLLADNKIEKVPGSSRSIRLVTGRAGARSRGALRSLPAPPLARVPLMGTIAAGLPIMAATDSDEYVELLAPHTDVFALRVKGDSMIGDHIQDGDVVVVEGRDVVRDGEMAVVLIREAADDPGEATLKRVYREADGRIRLQPSNPTMMPFYYPAEQVVIQGRVHAVLRTC
ncbi:MAG: transcriptional repressor LexA [Chloroflexota bacterium]